MQPEFRTTSGLLFFSFVCEDKQFLEDRYGASTSSCLHEAAL